jgi:uncharacterized membrane protein YedE/YeeE
MDLTSAEWVLWLALAIGLVYGVIGQLSGFCLNSALRDQLTHNHGTKLRAFMLALLVAIIGSQAFDALGLIDLSQSIYQPSRASWILVLIGGILFGFGMMRARGCGARALVLLGQGNLRSLVVLLCLGITGYMTFSGILAPLRSSLSDATAVSVQSATFTTELGRWSFVALLALAILTFLFKDRSFLRQRMALASGVIIGLLVVAGWLTTGWVGADDFDPVPLASLTFVAPVGATIQYAMIATGMTLNFGVAVVLGIVLGSFLSAQATGKFALTGFERPTDMPRYLGGATCMGVGGALAFGCSIGQGLTGMSTLSLWSMVALTGIVSGGWLALRLEGLTGSSAEPIQRQPTGGEYQ